MNIQELDSGMDDTLFAIAYLLLFFDLIVIHTLWVRVVLFSCVIALVAIYVYKSKIQ